MGTSTSHRSPATAEWDRVRELYLTPNPAPGEIVSRIVAALDEAARQRLHDAATVRCLDSVLRGSAELSESGAAALPSPEGSGYPALNLAGGLRQRAQESIAAERIASMMGTLALEAIPPTVIGALGPMPAWHELPAETVATQYARYTREGDLSALTGQFLAHDLDQVFRYLVTRDLSDFVGEGAASTVTEAARLVDRVGDFCRERGVAPGLRRYEQDLQEIVYLPPERRARELAPVTRQGLLDGLAELSGG